MKLFFWILFVGMGVLVAAAISNVYLPTVMNETSVVSGVIGIAILGLGALIGHMAYGGLSAGLWYLGPERIAKISYAVAVAIAAGGAFFLIRLLLNFLD